MTNDDPLDKALRRQQLAVEIPRHEANLRREHTEMRLAEAALESGEGDLAAALGARPTRLDIALGRSQQVQRRLRKRAELEAARVTELEHRLAASKTRVTAARQTLQAAQQEYASLADEHHDLDLAADDPTTPDVAFILAEHPPAHTVAEADIVDLTRDLEPLLELADAYEADDSNPPDLRYAVAQRARTLRGELHIHGDVAHDAILITRSAAFLMATLAGQLQGKVNDDEAQAGRHIAEAADQLPDDDTAIKGATDMVDALENVATPPPPPGEPPKTLRRRALEGAAAGGGAAAAKPAGEYIGRTLGALVRAGWAILKARFPWLPDLP
jgi:hypothetical protein